MTTYSHSVTGLEIVTDALLMVGGIGENEVVTGDNAGVTFALRTLNNMIKALQRQGYHLWSKRSVTLFLNAGQAMYSLGPAETDDHWTESYLSTTLNGAAAATTLTVDSTDGVEDGDFVGIELTDGTRHWSTVTQVTSTTLKINDALPSAAADGLSVITYTTRPQRPLKIEYVTANDIPVDIQAYEVYLAQPNKTGNGTVIMVTYQPTLVSGMLYVWMCGTVNQTLKMLIEHPLADIDVGDNPDFPIEWAEALTYNLAARLSNMYRILSGERRAEIRQDAARYLAEVSMFDSEGSVQFVPG